MLRALSEDRLRRVLVVDDQKLAGRLQPALARKGIALTVARTADRVLTTRLLFAPQLIVVGSVAGMSPSRFWSEARHKPEMRGVRAVLVSDVGAETSAFLQVGDCQHVAASLELPQLQERVCTLVLAMRDHVEQVGLHVLATVELEEAGGARVFANTVTVGGAGIVLECQEVPAAGANLRVSFFLPGRSEGRFSSVVRVGAAVDEELMHYEMEYVQVQPEARQMLQAWLASRAPPA